MDSEKITLIAQISAPLEEVWEKWTQPAHIMNWNFAVPEWHCPAASNDLRPGGAFSYTMAARDGSFSFDFGGEFIRVDAPTRLDSKLGDGRQILVTFAPVQGGTQVTQCFDPEQVNPRERQEAGWQAILNQFKAYVEGA